MLATPVGVDHRLVLLHHGRYVLGDLLAEIEHRQAVAQAHHQLHVMLDQQYVATPSRRICLISTLSCEVSMAFMPAAGSSSASNWGSVASARAIPRRRWSPPRGLFLRWCQQPRSMPTYLSSS